MLFLFAISASAALPEAAKPPLVTVVLSDRGGSYEEFSDALDALLSPRNISHQVIDSSAPVPASGLVIAVGTKAATAVAASNAPAVLNVLITRASHAKLLHDFPERAASHAYSAIYLDQPIERQARLIAALLPGKGRVGILYSTPPKELAQMQQKLVSNGLTLHAQALEQGQSLSDALQHVLDDSDVLLALPDAAVYNDTTIRNILLASYRANTPLIGLSPGYVKAGALSAVFSTPAQISAQAAAMAAQFGEVHVLPPAQYPQEFEVMVNEQVARSLGLPIRHASALHDAIDGNN